MLYFGALRWYTRTMPFIPFYGIKVNKGKYHAIYFNKIIGCLALSYKAKKEFTLFYSQLSKYLLTNPQKAL